MFGKFLWSLVQHWRVKSHEVIWIGFLEGGYRLGSINFLNGFCRSRIWYNIECLITKHFRRSFPLKLTSLLPIIIILHIHHRECGPQRRLFYLLFDILPLPRNHHCLFLIVVVQAYITGTLHRRALYRGIVPAHLDRILLRLVRENARPCQPKLIASSWLQGANPFPHWL